MNSSNNKSIFMGIVLLLFFPTLGNTTENEMDKSIKFSIEEALRDDPRFMSPPIKVFVANGIVSLAGVIQNLAEKEYAVLIAKKIHGVIGVIDQMVLHPHGILDSKLRDQIIREYRLSILLSEEPLHISVKNGIVSITGTVSSQAKKHEAQFLASTTAGVREIENKIIVAIESQVPDLEIQREVADALNRDAYLFRSPINVQARDGEISLTGEVSNAYLKDLAQEIALLSASVRKVNNEIKIIPKLGEKLTEISERLSNEYVKNQINAQLRYDSRISESDSVEIIVNSGYVRLMGYVSTAYQKKIIETNIRNLVGVLEVINFLEVISDEPETKISITDIEAVLQSDAILSGHPIEVQLHDGVVTLSGRVHNSFEKVFAGEIVQRFQGIKKVNNDIHFSKHKIFLNKVLKMRVKKRLSANAFTKNIADKIRVRVKEGNAILKGEVELQSERTEAEKVAYFTEGIWAVSNRLTIKKYDGRWEDSQPIFPENNTNPYVRTYEWYFFPGRL